MNKKSLMFILGVSSYLSINGGLEPLPSAKAPRRVVFMDDQGRRVAVVEIIDGQIYRVQAYQDDNQVEEQDEIEGLNFMCALQ